MHIAIRSTESQKKELLTKGFGNKVSVEWFEPYEKLTGTNADVYYKT